MRAAPAILAALAALSASCSKPAPAAYATADYTSWARTTSIALDYPIPGHMDNFRIARINPIGAAARPGRQDGKARWDFPAGTVVVKEVYPSPKPLPGERPSSLTIMAKQPDDPRSRGGWLWITRSLPEGEEKVFEGNFCIACHANANEGHPYGDRNAQKEFRDYVFFVPEAPSGGEGSGG